MGRFVAAGNAEEADYKGRTRVEPPQNEQFAAASQSHPTGLRLPAQSIIR
jgi:hypothetical protein